MEKKTLIIAEKPSAAAAIAQALGGFRKRAGYLESQDYLLSWAIGHLVQICEPEEYDPRYKKWKLSDLPILPAFRLKPNPKTKSQLEILRELGKRATALINACDSAREGELVFGYIVDYFNWHRMPAYRLWTASLTEEAIQKAFQSLRPGRDYQNLLASAKCRSEGDWIVGINSTRAFTSQFGDLYSLGRVQTPVLALLYKNWQARNSFVSQPFWEIKAKFQLSNSNLSYEGKWFTEDSSRLNQEEEAKQIIAEIEQKPSIVQKYKESSRKEYPPKLFDLTTLQRTCNAKFGFSAHKTLSLAQSLYEQHKAITYPRTNSQYVGDEELKEMIKVLHDLKKQGAYQELARAANSSFIHKKNNLIYRPGAIEDHPAILPTGKTPKGLSKDAEKVFDEIVRRFLAHFYPPAVHKTIEIVTGVGTHQFRSSSDELLEPGYRVVLPKAEAKKEGLPEVKIHDAGVCISGELLAGRTEPPKPFTEGTLLGAMETSGKDLQDEDLREAMKDSGLGTPATRAGIIERLKQVGYLQAKGKTLEITDKGIQLIELLQTVDIPVLLSAEMTGSWEKYLAQVARGSGKTEVFMKNIALMTEDLVAKVKASPLIKRKPKVSVSVGTCPLCGADVVKGFRGYTCTSSQSKCKFLIWKTIRGKAVSETQAKELLLKGVSRLITFYAKGGKKYKARFVLKRETGEITVEVMHRQLQS